VVFIDYNYLTLYFSADVSSSEIVYLSTDRSDDESRAYAHVRARGMRPREKVASGVEEASGREAGERDVDRNSGERNRTIMMRFIESIVRPGSRVHRHNWRVSIAGAPRRERERERERAALFNQLSISRWYCVHVNLMESARRAGYQLAPRCSQRYIRRIVFVDSAWIHSNFCSLCQPSPSLSLYFSSITAFRPSSPYPILINLPVFSPKPAVSSSWTFAH